MARRKSVLLLTPTTCPPPLSPSHTCPERLARPSTMEQYTPPCTMPHGCSSLSVICNRARPPSAVNSMYSTPSSLSNPLPNAALTSIVTQMCLHAAEGSAAEAPGAIVRHGQEH